MAAKRLLDIVGSLAGLVLLSPILLITATVILIRMGRPILFRQTRPGFKEEPFKIYKFRTMAEQWDAEGRLLPDEKRLNHLGRFLRNSSIDELPELWNVLRGEMSLVGPRPLLMQYLPRYNPEQKRRHNVKPGITGWAQIHGRNAVSFEDRFRLDVWYVDHWSFWLDIKILFRTILKTWKREGISAAGHPTMPEFLGSETKSLPEQQTK